MIRDEPIDIVLGLPGPLPAGERVLWHGKPERAALLRYLFRWRLLAAYFAVFALLPMLATAQAGASAAQVIFSPLLLLPIALPIAGLVAVSAWALARTTVYVVTDRRVILQVGVAFTRTVNIPLDLIADVSARERARGMDLALTLRGTDKIAWLALWPHARTLRFAQPVPMLRGLPVDSPAGAILVDAIMHAAPGLRHSPARAGKAPVAID
ncbi:MAG: PH domain-containing protein, partial [Alphaproteobacteria bacterium]|nr:PH domain-containing protein [Alphaproteobacteria bacterium]